MSGFWGESGVGGRGTGGGGRVSGFGGRETGDGGRSEKFTMSTDRASREIQWAGMVLRW